MCFISLLIYCAHKCSINVPLTASLLSRFNIMMVDCLLHEEHILVRSVFFSCNYYTFHYVTFGHGRMRTQDQRIAWTESWFIYNEFMHVNANSGTHVHSQKVGSYIMHSCIQSYNSNVFTDVIPFSQPINPSINQSVIYTICTSHTFFTLVLHTFFVVLFCFVFVFFFLFTLDHVLFIQFCFASLSFSIHKFALRG